MYPGGQIVDLNTRVTPAFTHLTVVAFGGTTFRVDLGALFDEAVGFGVTVVVTFGGSLNDINNGEDSTESLIELILKLTIFPK